MAAWDADEITDCWLDDPLPDDRRSWAVPAGHGTYRGLDLEQLDPDDEDERTFLLEAQHLDMEEALKRHEEMPGPDGEPINPTLHVALHGMIANQLLADDPPETWQTVQRLAGLGYDWHNVMHLIMGPVTDAVYGALSERQPFDRADYVPAAGRTTRRLAVARGTRPALTLSGWRRSWPRQAGWSWCRTSAPADHGLGLPSPFGQAGDLQVQALLQPLPGGRADRAVLEEPG